MLISKSVFLIEDELELLDLLADLLENCGYEVKKFSNAMDAVLESARRMPDYIITDLNAPSGRNGLDLIRDVRERNQTLPILLMTGDPIHELVGDLRSLDVKFMQKPIELKAILNFLMTSKPSAA